MATLLDSLRGTLVTVLGAADHIAWYVEWQAGGRRCARCPEASPVTRHAGAPAEARAV